MVLFLSFYILYYHKLVINIKFMIILSAFMFLSFFNLFLDNISLFLLLKQIIGFIFNGLVYYLLIKINRYNIDRLFRTYLNLAFTIALIGIFQEISFLCGFTYGYDYTYFLPNFRLGGTVMGLLRVSSILPEPSHFGAAMAPAAFVSVLSIFKRENIFISKKKSFLILISFLLSFSIVSYCGIVFAIILIMLNYKRIKLIVTGTIIISAFAVASYSLPMIRMRVDDTIAVFSGKKPMHEANLSTFAVCSNGFIAYKSFMNNPLIGSGLGSHPLSYDRYLENVDPAKTLVGLNKKDASGLFLRLISETGILGVSLFIYFIFRFYVSRTRDDYLWIISNSIICLIVLNLLRQGNYFYNGFMFFVWAYYWTYINASENRKRRKYHELIDSEI